MSNDNDGFSGLEPTVSLSLSENSMPKKGRKRNREPDTVDPVRRRAKNLKDQIDREITKDKKLFLEIIVFVVRLLMDICRCDLIPQFLGFLKQIETKWPVDIPVRSAILDIKQTVKKILDKYSEDSATAAKAAKTADTAKASKAARVAEAAKAKAMQGLDQMEMKIAELKQRLEEHSIEKENRVEKLVDFFLNNKAFDNETLRTELFSFIQWMMDWHNPQLQHSLLDISDSLSEKHSSCSGFGEDLASKYRGLKKQLYDENNNQVENRDFQGLEAELNNTTGRKVPDYLELIATRIVEDRGKATCSAHFSVLVLVCAAVKEMEDTVEVLDWEMLKKWAAVLNQARQLRFQVGFADKLLETKLLAYFASTELLKETKKKLV